MLAAHVQLSGRLSGRLGGDANVAAFFAGEQRGGFGLGLSMHRGTFQADDVDLREKGVVRIYDVFFDYGVLLDTDAFFRQLIAGPEFQRPMSTAEFHHLCGKYMRAREEKLGLKHRSLLAAAYEFAVPIYTSSPGDSSIGMNVAAMALEGNKLALDVSADVNETAAIVWAEEGFRLARPHDRVEARPAPDTGGGGGGPG